MFVESGNLERFLQQQRVHKTNSFVGFGATVVLTTSSTFENMLNPNQNYIVVYIRKIHPELFYRESPYQAMAPS